MPDLRVDEVPETGLMLPACCDTEAMYFTDPTTKARMVRILHEEDCPDCANPLCAVCFPHGPDQPCTCNGCWICAGHVFGCTCDIGWDCEHER